MKFQNQSNIMSKWDVNIGNGGVNIATLKADELNGLYAELANLIGIESTVQIYSQYKGQQITFPTRLISRDSIVSQLKSEFDGSNYKELASRYNYSERWVRSILKKENKIGGV